MHPWQQVIDATSGSIPGPSVNLEDCAIRTIDATHALFIASRNSFSATDAFLGVVEFDATPSIAVVGSPLAVPGTIVVGGYAWGDISTPLPGTDLALLLGTYQQSGGGAFTAHQLASFDTSTGACALIGSPWPFAAGTTVSGENPVTVNPTGSGPPPGAVGWALGADATHFIYGFNIADIVTGLNSLWLAAASIDTSTGIMTYVTEVVAVDSTIENATIGVGPISVLQIGSGDWLATTFGGTVFAFHWNGSALTASVVATSSEIIGVSVVEFGGEWRVYGLDPITSDLSYAVVASDLSGIGSLVGITAADIHGDPEAIVVGGNFATSGDATRVFGATGTILVAGDTHARGRPSGPISGFDVNPGPGRYCLFYGGASHPNVFVLVGEELSDRFAEADVGPPDFATAVDTGQPVTVDCSTDHLDNYWRPITAWSLDWGDGTIETGSGPLTAEPYGPTFPNIVLNRGHTFFLPGTYVVTFSVVDSLAIASTPDIPVTFVVTRSTPPWQRSYPRPDDLGAGSHRSYPPPATRQRSSRSIPAAIE